MFYKKENFLTSWICIDFSDKTSVVETGIFPPQSFDPMNQASSAPLPGEKTTDRTHSGDDAAPNFRTRASNMFKLN
jgi:hypothetical protein